MMARLRQLPLVALLFVAGSPGLGGVALQAIHACTAELGVAASAQAAEAAHHGGHHGEEPEDDACRCIGACHAPFFTPAPHASVIAQVELPPRHDLPVPHLADVPPAGRAHRLLPPATAPPLS
ncbi:MAG TPA: hypothetical protein VFT04_08760 [Gemmatimonadales bacterium]|nr:hypothetical protein [Gemmatimonadales bacterium]